MLTRITIVTTIIAFTAAVSNSKTLGHPPTHKAGVEIESCIPDVPPELPEVTVIALHDEAEFEYIPAAE